MTVSNFELGGGRPDTGFSNEQRVGASGGVGADARVGVIDNFIDEHAQPRRRPVPSLRYEFSTDG